MVRLPSEGRARVVIEDVAPVVDGGRFPFKSTLGERIRVDAAICADRFRTWQADLKKRIAAAQDLGAGLVIGSQFIVQASARASGYTGIALSEELLTTMQAWPDRSHAIHYERELTSWVEPLNWAHTQAGWITLNLDVLGLDRSHSFEVQDLLSGRRFLRQGPSGHVELLPVSLPGHILRARFRARTERDFDYL